MSDLPVGLSRRCFVGGLLLAGLTPLWSRLDALAWHQEAGRFSGDDFEMAHRLLQRPQETLAQGTPELERSRYDVLVVGGGVAGLTVAYKLRKRRVLLLEREAEPGGAAKSESWQGIDYALGAAYIIDPDPDSADPREAANFALLEELDLRKRREDLVRGRSQRRLSGESNHCVFGNRRVIPEAEVYTRRNRRFFKRVLGSENYPSVPPTHETLVGALDRISFADFLRDAVRQRRLYGQSVGPISSLGWEAIEYYCWGAFGASAAETSAYHGLNFFAAEFGDVLVFPGGNGFITRRLAERIRRDNAESLRMRSWVLEVEREGDDWGVTTWEDGKLRRYRARSVVFASPLFLASKLITSLPASQHEAIASLDYRSYVVANVLLRRPVARIFEAQAAAAFRDGYELTRVHGEDIRRKSAKAISSTKVYSDAIVADFAARPHPTHAVLTVYRPFPYASGRAELMQLSYAQIEGEVRRELLAGFAAHGLRPDDIVAVRLARWGHAMVAAHPGQLADGTLSRAARPQPGLYFAHTDVYGAPAFENALAAAHDAVAAVERFLAAG